MHAYLAYFKLNYLTCYNINLLKLAFASNSRAIQQYPEVTRIFLDSLFTHVPKIPNIFHSKTAPTRLTIEFNCYLKRYAFFLQYFVYILFLLLLETPFFFNAVQALMNCEKSDCDRTYFLKTCDLSVFIF